MSVLSSESSAAPSAEVPPDDGARHRLTTVTGLAALSLDAMASVAYGPEAIVLVPAAAGGYGLGFTLPVTVAIALLLAVLVLIPEAEPARLWQRLLQNQRGAVVAHAVRHETNAVICRLRFRLLDDSAEPR